MTTKKTTTEKPTPRPTKKPTAPINVCVECQLRDGSDSMFVGRLVSRDVTTIVLVDAAFIAYTGRRHLFFAGTPDSLLEAEPYADGQTIELPAEMARITSWPHPLFRVPR